MCFVFATSGYGATGPTLWGVILPTQLSSGIYKNQLHCTQIFYRVSASQSSRLSSLSSPLNLTFCNLQIFQLSIFISSVFIPLIFLVLHFFTLNNPNFHHSKKTGTPSPLLYYSTVSLSTLCMHDLKISALHRIFMYRE